MIKAVIIEDEPLLGKSLALMLKEYIDEIQVVAMLDSGNMALELLPSINYDLIFSDIQLGDMDAFTLFEVLGKPDKPIIFITAHDEFALNSFKLNTIDYLLKPILPEDLIRGVRKVLDRIQIPSQKTLKKEQTGIQKNSKIVFRNSGQLQLISPEHIIYCEAQGTYTRIYLDNESDPKLVPTHLKKIESILSNKDFYRIHNAHFINCNFFNHILFQKRICVLKNGVTGQKIELKIADRKFQGFIEFLKKI